MSTATLNKLVAIETKLVFRDLLLPLLGIGLPLGLLLIFGSIPAVRHPDQDLGGLRGIDTVIPSLSIAVALAMVGFVMLPAYLTTYRERGVLRRLATTPVRPAALLGAQLLIHLAMTLGAVALVLGIGTTTMDMTLPKHPLGFLLALALSILALFSIGLLVAAVAAGPKVANGVGMGLWFVSAFFAGIYLPKEVMPHALSRIGDFTPLGAARQSIQDAWGGSGPQPLHLVVLAAVSLIAGTAAVRLFRWR